jgi:two-component system phosphate regulon sensor histidine kinase PhoR
MKKWQTLFHPALVFVLAQIAWVSLVGLWIYWYVSNYIIFNTVGDKLSPQIVSKSTNVYALVGGLVLLAAILTGMSLIFIYLNKQQNLTKLYDNFIANVTHELKSPLASIRLYLETMKLRTVPEEKKKEFLGLMIKDATRLEKLINSILEISGLERKKIAHNFHIYPAEETVKEILQESREQFKLPQQAIRIEGSTRCSCVFDRDALKIVFDNLIDNAIKYSKDPVRIDIEMQRDSKNVIITFGDSGIGIPSGERKSVFKKFHRIYTKDVPNVKGTGLGLYWVKEIVKLHGGKVGVVSNAQQKGTTFRLELPIYQESKRRYINSLLKLTLKREKQQAIDDEEK